MRLNRVLGRFVAYLSKLVELIDLTGNPLQDVELLQGVNSPMKSGKIYLQPRT